MKLGLYYYAKATPGFHLFLRPGAPDWRRQVSKCLSALLRLFVCLRARGGVGGGTSANLIQTIAHFERTLLWQERNANLCAIFGLERRV